MGAGRRTETYIGSTAPTLSHGSSLHPPNFLNLPPDQLGAVIFFCNKATMKECINDHMFGLPHNHISYVQNVQPEMPLFLFNCSDRRLHGLFEATSAGKLYINHYSWSSDGGKTPYPAQVRVMIKQQCQSLPESVFKEVIMTNYYSDTHFASELNHVQTRALISLFLSPQISDFPARPQAMITPNARKKGVNGAIKLQQEEEEEEDSWIKSKKTTTDLWDSASAFKSPSQSFVSTQLQDPNGTPEHWDDDLKHVETGGTSSSGAKSFSVNAELIMPKMKEAEPEAKEQASYYKSWMLDGRSDVLSSNPDRPSHAQSDIGPIAEEQVKTDQEQEQDQERALAILEKLHQQRKISKGKGKLQEKAEVSAASTSTSGENELPEWEKLARERCLQEQTMLREDRERLRESLQVMDSSVAKSVQKNLELCAAAIAQMHQDKLELKRVLGEVSADLESLREVARLRKRNAELEHSQVQMASDLQLLKLEVARISQRLEVVSQGERLVSDNFLTGNSCSESNLEWQQSSHNVYLLGGHDGESLLETVDIFCPVANTLRPVAPMLAARFCAAATVLMGQLYIFGGGNGESYFETAETYNNKTNEWSVCAPMSLKRGSLAGATVGDRIFALGGGNGHVSFSDVECYDAHLGIWISSTSMLYKRFCVAAAELDGALYAIGGYDGKSYLKSMERFDPREALWTTVAPMNKKRGSLSAAVLGGKIYAIGGFDGSEVLSSVEFYEPRRNCWLEMEQQMHTRRAYGAVAVIGESLYMIGGLNSGIYLDSVECYRERTGWEVVQSDVLGKRCFLAGAVLE